MADLALEYGQALVASSKWPEAIAALSRATQLSPTSSRAGSSSAAPSSPPASGRTPTSRWRGSARSRAAQKSNTARINQEQSDTDDPTGRNLRQAVSLATTGRLDKALAMIRQEIQLQPRDPRPRAAEVMTLLNAKHPQEALKAAADALSAEPGNPDFLYLRGAVKMALRDLPGAEQDFRQTLQVKPDHVAAMSDLAVLLTASGKKDEARQLLQKVLELKPGDPVATANLEKLGTSG